jgi:hypothetical protein
MALIRTLATAPNGYKVSRMKAPVKMPSRPGLVDRSLREIH